ncbi:guanine nucleotide-binding protein-like NSN1 [Rutidosis leptorrhynchoides]|uniref:guanine nucleotide-binding protein-like NSN1 n=1 Tax=Rutidosis leptorrhynchoides TaxID=125765 RepID=UPI003A993308
MPKRSKKSKSKRVTLKQKHKVIKKVKEHHKKKAKEAKKLGLNKRTKVEKDPGIPNDWPFKEQELKALEARRTKALEEIEQKKAARKERAKKRKLGLLEDDGDDITDLAEQVSAKEQEFGRKKVTDNSSNTPERLFYKELAKVIEASDVILEVLDARDPIGTRCIDMEKMVLKAGPEKNLVLLLNKIDLVPREAAEKWLKYLREELPAVAFKCSTQKQKTNLGWKSLKTAKKNSNFLQTSDCLGAETLLKLLKNYSRSHEVKKSITVGVVGLPNVGKSSLINSLKRCHAVNVGATPGLTRTMQQVQLDKDVKLLDCPGVVMLKSGENDAVAALRNCLKIEKLVDPVSSVMEILELCPKEMLVALYKIPTFASVDDFLSKVASVRGKLKKGGFLDTDAAARTVLQDWNEGKIQYYTMPPVRNEGEAMEAKIVSKLGIEFNVHEVYGTESSYIGSLKSVNELNPVEIPPMEPVVLDESMLEDDKEPETAPDESNTENEEDEAMAEDKDAPETKVNKSTSQQNEKLNAAEGVLKSKQKKAEKKRRKEDTESAAMEEEDEPIDGDYDFKVDYLKKGSTDMDVVEVADDDDDNDDQDDGSVDKNENKIDVDHNESAK